jgi:recombination protein RecT
MRTGQFLNINQTDVRLGEIKSRDRLEGTIDFEWIEIEEQRLKTPVIGYASTFRLQNGFKSVFYMSIEELEAHAKKFSKVYAKGGGLWATDKKGMCEKTVTKLNLSKNAPLSVEDKANKNLVNALRADQAVISDFENINTGVEFPDNTQDTEFTFIDPKTEATAMEDETMNKINSKK